MAPIDIKLPLSARLLFNSLFDTKEASLLEQGLVSVVLENGRHIDVSWHPEHDPAGRYIVTVYGDSWSDKLEQCTVGSAQQAAIATSSLAESHMHVAPPPSPSEAFSSPATPYGPVS